MSHLTTELCEKYPGERIPEWEYDFEAKEWAAIGFFPTAVAERSRLRLPRGCFFSQSGTKVDVLRAWDRITLRLGRKVRLECTIGESFGKDLEPFQPEAAPSHQPPPAEAQHPIPLEDTLSSAFIKLFGTPTSL